MPLMDPLRESMLTALERNDSLYELSLCFPDLVNDLISANMPWPPHDTIRQLGNDHNADWTSLELLHAVPRKLLTAIVRGTVAYDCENKAIRGYEKKKDGAPDAGIYVIGIYLKNRNYKFLTYDEITTITRELESYIDAYRICKNGGPKNTGEEAKVQAAVDIDGAYDKSIVTDIQSVTRLRFIDSSGGVEKMRCLVAGLRRRRRPLQHVADGQIHQHQSPLYVGCSTKLQQRLKDYSTTNRMDSINKPLALLMCALKKAGLEPEFTQRVVLKTWQPAQLPTAERLVIAMARSYLWQDGFNVAEGGGKSGNAHTTNAQVEVMTRMPYMSENVTRTLQDIGDRARFLESFKTIRGAETEILSLAQTIDEDSFRIDQALAKWDKLKNDAARQRDTLRDLCASSIAEGALLKELDELSITLCAAFGVDKDAAPEERVIPDSQDSAASETQAPET
ncbi:hypothetical protein K4K58_002110 [Colletotrichum sp. SAR11_239]|nr:hypothetical protein K4K58_002110 [Colletotrichum sp. SAR11_239]